MARCWLGTVFSLGNSSEGVTNLSANTTVVPARREEFDRAPAFTRPLFFVGLAATAAIIPMLFLGNASGHDFQFHLSSWLDVAGQWREGILFPRWAEWANWGYGEPRFIFYPPISWLLGAALGSLLPWRMAPGAYIWLVLILSGMCMWRFAREFFPSRDATVAAILYAVNPYFLVLVYYRSDFAELLASAIFPLLLLGILGVARKGWKGVPLLSAAFAAIWLSNAPAAVISTYSFSLLLAVCCAFQRSARTLLIGALALLLGLGLAAFYIVPAAYEQRWVQISLVLGENLAPEKNFLFTHSGDPQFVLFNWKISGIALGTILLTALAAVFLGRRRREFSAAWWMLIALAAASSLLMFPPAEVFWRYLPKLRFVQFPWRWDVPLAAAYAVFLAVVSSRLRRAWLAWLAILLIISGLAAAIIRDAWWDSMDIPVLAAGIRADQGFEGVDEYAPIGFDRYAIPGADTVTDEQPVPPGLPVPRMQQFDSDSGSALPESGVQILTEDWTAEHRVFSEESLNPVTLAVRLANYPTWNLQVDGADTPIEFESPEGEVLVPLSAGAHRVELSFRRTQDRTVGIAISGISFLVFLAGLGASRRGRRLT